MAHTTRCDQSLFRRCAAGVLAAAIIAGAGLLAYEMALQSGLLRLRNMANDRLSLLELTVDATVERFRYLPTALAQASAIINVYQHPDQQRARDLANRYLKSLNDAAGSSDIYVLDDHGVALAASNYLENTNFIGKNYAFRPYFTDALKSPEGRYYAVGATTGKPGYFLWHSVADEADRTLGVAVVKVDLHSLQAEWKRTGDLVAIADPNNVIFLSSRPRWQYRPMAPLSSGQLRELQKTRQYGHDIDNLKPLFSRQRTERGLRVVHIDGSGIRPGRDYVVFSRLLPSHGWNLVVLVALQVVKEQAAIVAAAVMLAILVALLAALVTHQRRQMIRAKLNAHRVLEVRVTERTAELAATNALLSAEICERIKAEEDLRRMQDSLAHATKMASLGQALAGVAHEVNQSLTALMTYIAGARVLLDRGETQRTLSNLDLISAIVARMGALTQHLKSFARKDNVAKQATDLAAAIRYALRLVDYRVSEQRVTLTLRLPERPVYAMGNAVRLEQVIVNLLSNALDAMRDRAQRDLLIDLRCHASSAILQVTDTGHGMSGEQLNSVFDPFYTTKDVDQGLGLGLSISYGIIRDMGGEITVESELERGTTFQIVLPLVAAMASQAQVLLGP